MRAGLISGFISDPPVVDSVTPGQCGGPKRPDPKAKLIALSSGTSYSLIYTSLFSVFYICSFIRSSAPSQAVSAVILPILQARKLRHREVKQLPTAQPWSLSAVELGFEPVGPWSPHC